jgi:hypothetical protein
VTVPKDRGRLRSRRRWGEHQVRFLVFAGACAGRKGVARAVEADASGQKGTSPNLSSGGSDGGLPLKGLKKRCHFAHKGVRSTGYVQGETASSDLTREKGAPGAP